MSALLLGGALAACAAITGVGSYSKGDCSGGGDCDGGEADSSVETDSHAPGTDSAQGETAPPDGTDMDGADDADGAALEAGPEAGPDAKDSSSDATDTGVDAHDAGPDADAAPDGCGPLTTTTNCGACGATCSTTNAASETCTAGSCAYVCDPGWANCNPTPPNTGGCSTATNTTTHCGGCNNACTLTSASAATCNGVTCAYTCIANHSDCNLGTAPDTDGCECATPSCCGAACQTVHSTGTGQSFYDCNPKGTFNAVTAIEACTAYAVSVGGTAANCSDGWMCNNKPPSTVCYGDTTGTTCQTFCWGYTGSQGGVLYTCACPNVSAGSWN